MKIYHNPRCSKSRQTLQLIREAGVDAEVIEYLNSPPTAAELEHICKMLESRPQDLIRRKDAKAQNVTPEELSAAEAIDVMSANPQLIERPIVVDGKRAVVGRPPENVLELLGSD